MYLVDTNVWLELLLNQEKAVEVRKFCENVEAHLLGITEFTLYSIAIILFRLNKVNVLWDFISDTIEDIKQLILMNKEIKLDFDDEYQYFAAQKYEYILIRFDSDFDMTERGRKTPAEILNSILR